MTVSRNIQEKEADLFSSFILMPDIVLLTKIIYQQKSFQELMRDLSVSKQALEIRLLEFLHYQGDIPFSLAKKLLNDYITRKNNKLQNKVTTFAGKIIAQYKKIKIKPIDKLKHLLKTKDFITHLDLPELEDREFCEEIKRTCPHIRTWSYYDKGNTLHYAYDTRKISEEVADRKRKLALYDLHQKENKN